MNKIEIHTTAPSNFEVRISGKTLNELKIFLENLDNGSFESIILQHNHETDLMYVAEEKGVKHPGYEKFITSIQESEFGELFCWDC